MQHDVTGLEITVTNASLVELSDLIENAASHHPDRIIRRGGEPRIEGIESLEPNGVGRLSGERWGAPGLVSNSQKVCLNLELCRVDVRLDELGICLPL
jgi:hypothetical protein